MPIAKINKILENYIYINLIGYLRIDIFHNS